MFYHIISFAWVVLVEMGQRESVLSAAHSRLEMFGRYGKKLTIELNTIQVPPFVDTTFLTFQIVIDSKLNRLD